MDNQTKKIDAYLDRHMTCSFTSFSTAFQSHQDDARMIMNGCVFSVKKILPRMGLKLGTASSTGKRLTD